MINSWMLLHICFLFNWNEFYSIWPNKVNRDAYRRNMCNYMRLITSIGFWVSNHRGFVQTFGLWTSFFYEIALHFDVLHPCVDQTLLRFLFDSNEFYSIWPIKVNRDAYRRTVCVYISLIISIGYWSVKPSGFCTNVWREHRTLK